MVLGWGVFLWVFCLLIFIVYFFVWFFFLGLGGLLLFGGLGGGWTPHHMQLHR